MQTAVSVTREIVRPVGPATEHTGPGEVNSDIDAPMR